MAKSTSPADKQMSETLGDEGPNQALLSREALIRLEQDSPVRQKAIIRLADRLVNSSEGLNLSHATCRMLPDTNSKAETKAKMEYYDDVYKALENARAEWATSEDARELNVRLTDAVKQKKLVSVRNIVCFGLAGPECWGTGKPLTDDAKLKGHGNRSLIQHVAALFMADVITQASENKEKVKVYSQDPMYRPHDIAALEAHGIRVLDAGRREGFVKVGADTLVFLMGAGTPILRVLCETTRPAAIICTLLRQNQDVEGAHAVLKLLDSEYDECADWLPFFHPLVHLQVVQGPQTMAELARYGLRPLQGASVRLLKPEFSTGDPFEIDYLEELSYCLEELRFCG